MKNGIKGGRKEKKMAINMGAGEESDRVDNLMYLSDKHCCDRSKQTGYTVFT